MGVPGPMKDRAEVDVRDLPRNEAPRHPTGPAADPRAGETAAQDRVPSADDSTLEATLLQRSTGQAGVDEGRRAERRDQSSLEDEPTPVRGPSADASTGRAVTERETVSDAAADADATERNLATQDDPDRA